jgi:pyroglutamyl-peptidase
MSLLVTGFGPFRDITDNPSSRLAEVLPGSTELLPVQYGKVEAFAISLRSRTEDTILCLGLNARATELKFELYAHNQIGTERGYGSRRHTRTVIKPSGPQTLGQTLLTPKQLGELALATSFTPGDYLCNFLLYSLLIRYPERRIGFVHVPLFEKVTMGDQLEQLDGLLQLVGAS